MAKEGAMLEATEIVDFHQADVRALAASLRGADDLATIRTCFEWVRDRIQHSSDFRRGPVTCVASDVLREGTGYCYAKSHLLVALLRANGIAAGFVYQRLTVQGSTPPFCLHGLVAAKLPSGEFFRMDPRGNRPGIDARFDPPREQLAFATSVDGERTFPGVYAEPWPEVVSALRRHGAWDALLADLPDAANAPRAPDVDLPLA